MGSISSKPVARCRIVLSELATAAHTDDVICWQTQSVTPMPFCCNPICGLAGKVAVTHPAYVGPTRMMLVVHRSGHLERWHHWHTIMGCYGSEDGWVHHVLRQHMLIRTNSSWSGTQHCDNAARPFIYLNSALHHLCQSSCKPGCFCRFVGKLLFSNGYGRHAQY